MEPEAGVDCKIETLKAKGDLIFKVGWWLFTHD
jgi:hypothetical protein